MRWQAFSRLRSWMTSDPAPDFSARLARVRAGEADAAEALLPLVYSELREIADRQLRRERGGHTLQATAVVHEAWLRMAGSAELSPQDRAHFVALAARSIRRVLVDHARTRGRLKRGRGAERLTLSGLEVAAAGTAQIDMLVLNDLLAELAKLSERQAQIVELRFFGGLTMPEISELLGVSLRTVEGDWTVARLWLTRALADDATP